MASEIRVNQIQSRTGLSTVTFSDTGIVVGNKISVGSAFIQNNAVGVGTTTTAGRNAGVGTAVGTIIYNETSGQLEVYKRNAGWVSIGSTNDPAPVSGPSGLTATGGVVSDYSDPGPGAVYRAHIFTSSGAFSVSALSPSLPNNVDIFAIGGGGGGSGGFPGYGPGRGGGAGGAFVATTYPVSVNTYPIIVGSGGAGARTGSVSPPFASGRGSSGNNSTFTNPSPQVLTAAGGGGGGDYDAPSAVAPASSGGPGGCGGGGGGYPGAPAPNIAGGTATQPSQNPGVSNLTNYGFAGGTGDNTTAGGGGAGGGTGGVGDNYSAPTNTLRSGGPGIPITYAYGPSSPVTYGAGGPTGGPNTGPTVDATYSTGNGGMGWLTNPSPSKGGNGGSGIVVVRYQIGSLTAAQKATGGSISYYGGKTIHTFTGSGTFATTSNWTAATVEYVVVGGGGGGGADAGGGGGAGGYLTGTTPIGAHPVSTTIQVGAGAAFPGLSGDFGGNGTPSYFGTPLTGYGGGGGGGGGMPDNTGSGSAGGSGGGSRGNRPGSTTGGPSPYTPTQGFAGGVGNAPGVTPIYSGGGGGAGGAGEGSGGTSNGGIGKQIPATFHNPVSSPPSSTGGGLGAPGPTATNVSGGTPGKFWVAGGGGGVRISATSGVGGGPGGPYAGAGNAAQPDTQRPDNSTSGIQNTGGGGGGATQGPPSPFLGTNGGSGIVLIAYPS